MTAVSNLRLGVDVGGTNTDAVIVDADGGLLARSKVPTTPDAGRGVRDALGAAIKACPEPASRISHVMVGTTHAANAIVERRGLRRVAVLRVGAPATTSIPPLSGWPDELRSIVSAGQAMVGGGAEFDGRELSPFDGDAVRRFLDSVAGRAEAVAVTSVFADLSDRHELAAASLVAEVLGDIPVTLSHEIGSLGLIERENATVLNAALGGVITGLGSSLEEACRAHGIAPAAYFAQNDGTLMAVDYAGRYPVLTIGSGTANSMRGAAFLTGVDDAVVVDVGGTTCDVGCLSGGFPRESVWPVAVGGITTNFRMPDLISLPLGGGSVIRRTSHGVELGPGSVGSRLTEEALCFGGSTVTLTDAAVAMRRTTLDGRAGQVRQRPAFDEALARVDEAMTSVVDRIKVARHTMPLIAVGGASFLVADELEGIDEVIRPADHDVANAIGAAIAPVSGYVDRIFRFGRGDREEALREARETARRRAIRAGADPARTEVVEVEQIPVAYVGEPAARVCIKAIGPLGAV